VPFKWCSAGNETETSEITVQSKCGNQAQRHIHSMLTCSKKHFISCVLHANVCLPIVEQVHPGLYEALMNVLKQCLTKLCITYVEMYLSIPS